MEMVALHTSGGTPGGLLEWRSWGSLTDKGLGQQPFALGLINIASNFHCLA